MSSFEQNKFHLIGRITKQPEIKEGQFGKTAILGLAINTPKKQQDGSWQDETCFFDIYAQGHLADKAQSWIKGQLITLFGTMKKNKENKIYLLASEVYTQVSKPVEPQPIANVMSLPIVEQAKKVFNPSEVKVTNNPYQNKPYPQRQQQQIEDDIQF